MMKGTRLSAKRLPVDERPRERLYRLGAGELSLQELLAVVLGGGTGGISPVAVAYALLERFGSLGALGRAGIDELARVSGIGFAKSCQLAASLELGKRLAREQPANGASIRSAADIAALLMDEMRYYDREHFKAAYLNTRNHLLKIETISIGSLNASIVHPREIMKPAVSLSAASIILVHNHPAGDPSPSREDVEFTRRFAKCGELMGIELLDHIVIGDGGYCSLKEMGLF